MDTRNLYATRAFIPIAVFAITVIIATFYFYNTSHIIQDSKMAAALQKICSEWHGGLDITAYTNKNGEVGGYLAFSADKDVVSDPPGALYDAHGTYIGGMGMAINDGDTERFYAAIEALRRDFPITQTHTCHSPE